MLPTHSHPVIVLLVLASLQSPSHADDANVSVSPSEEVSRLRRRVHSLEQHILRLDSERERLIDRLEADGKPIGNVPLVDAVAEFNVTYAGYPNSESQPPLSQEEVVAAIRFYQRDNATVTDVEFQRFKQVADTLELPRDFQFEVITTFRGPEYEIEAWSVRLVMPTHNGRRTWAFQIREKMIRCRKLTDQEKGNLVRDAGEF
jgi:hypothetical protein